MEFRQLIYFLTIAEEGNITRAAERLHLAQPPLSQQLKLLEEELGVTLLERSTRKMKLTDAGERLVRRAGQIVNLMDATSKEFRDYRQGLMGTLTIASIASSGTKSLIEWIAAFHEKYPGINFEIHEDSTFGILDQIKSGAVEIGIVRTPLKTDHFDSLLLPELPMAAVGAKQPWLSGRKTLTLKDLADQPLLVPSRFEPLIIEACHREGFTPRILLKCEDSRPLLIWASRGMGIAVVPQDFTELIPGLKLTSVPIDAKALHTGTAVVWLKNRYMTVAAQHFLEEVQSLLASEAVSKPSPFTLAFE